MKSATLKVVVIASALPKGYTGTQGEELELPSAEAHSLQKRGYVRILWNDVVINDMVTNKDKGTVTGLPKYKKPYELP